MILVCGFNVYTRICEKDQNSASCPMAVERNLDIGKVCNTDCATDGVFFAAGSSLEKEFVVGGTA
jgi:hypothetical protein